MCSSPNAEPLPTKRTEDGVIGECSEHRSFTEVLKSRSRTRVEANIGGDENSSSVECDMGRSVRAAGSGRKMRGMDDTGWVDELLGCAQLGLGRAVAGLLEGILDGPKSVTVRNRVRAVLKRLKGLKGVGFGSPSLSVLSSHVQGLRKGKFGVKGLGLGRLKRVRLKHLGLSSQQALEALCAGGEPPVPERGLVEVASTLSEGGLGATIGDGLSSGTEAVSGASIGDGSSPASSQEVPEAVLSEGCLGATIGGGLPPVRSLEVTEVVLGASEDGCPVDSCFQSMLPLFM